MSTVSAVLVLCTANACRSVMAQAMLSARLAARGVTVPVDSAGTLAGGRRPPPEVVAVMAARGVDVGGHVSRPVTADDVAAADLILGLAREHVRHAAVLEPAAWPRAFTLPELVRRGRQAGGRRPGEPLGAWLARAGDGRGRGDVLGSSPADDVADPAGGPLAGYQATAELLDRLTRDLVDLGWPRLPSVPQSPRAVRDKGF
jgi:protein-tyrosine phosphatase